MSHLQVLILKLRDSCGILWQRFQLNRRRVLSFWQPILWKKLRHYAPKWESWSRVNSNASEVLHTSRTNTEQALSLKLRSDKWLIKRSTNLFKKLRMQSFFLLARFQDVLNSFNSLELLSSFQKWLLLVLVLNTLKWRWRRLIFRPQISSLGNTHKLVDKNSSIISRISSEVRCSLNNLVTPGRLRWIERTIQLASYSVLWKTSKPNLKSQSIPYHKHPLSKSSITSPHPLSSKINSREKTLKDR